MPYAFTEQGVAMLSGILKSEKAIVVNILIMRAFVLMRKMIDSNKELSKKLEELEKKYDKQFSSVFQAIKALIYKAEQSEPIGYKLSKSSKNKQ
jgi:hypothetical protein